LVGEAVILVRPVLGVDYCGVFQLESEGKDLILRAGAGWRDGCVGHATVGTGRDPLSGYTLLADEPVIVEDLRAETRFTGPSLLHDHGVVSGVSVIVRGGDRPWGVMAAYTNRRRRFTQDDARFLQAVANLIATIIERQHLEAQREGLLAREQAARVEAEAANRAKDDFFATVSHELRAPLNAIAGWIQILRAGKRDEVTVTRALEALGRSVKSQGQLIDDLLDTARAAMGKLRVDRRVIELGPLIEAAVDVARPSAEVKGVRLETAADPAVRPVLGDPDRLRQVVSNLLSNAVEFTPRGGRIEVRLRQLDSRTEIVVSDTGHGISAQFLPHVFDRFRQADPGGPLARRGLGLGLAIVRELVNLHGGTVRAESPGVGRGATFTVRLPTTAVPVRVGEAAPGGDPLGEGSADLEGCGHS
jgi:signal transduction histidine kinase